MRILFFITLLLLSVQSVFAAENNKFGIHLAQPDKTDLQRAAELVNSNGGRWGYVTLVIQENDRDVSKWQDIFNNLRHMHLIPIIRLATSPQGEVWRKPDKNDADSWANFLNSLNWVIKNRYVILFNEPNHGSEWGGSVNASDYRDVALQFAKTLKAKNADFNIMLAGFDASAPSSEPNYEDEQIFLSSVFDTQENKDQWNNLLSGWVSHSYPNPGFVGSPVGSGRISVRTYDWEETLIQSWGIKSLPIFITETGWDGEALSRDTVANYIKTAYEQVWLPDERVMAVTPFVLNYQGPPFTNFSWQQFGQQTFYPQYAQVQAMPKQSGNPQIIDQGVIDYDFSDELVTDSSFHFRVSVHNYGQAIWNKDDGYHLALEGVSSPAFFADLINIQPFQTQDIDLYLKTDKVGKYLAHITLYKGDKKIIESKPWDFEVVPLPQLEYHVKLGIKPFNNGTDFEIQIFDEKEQLVFDKKGLTMKDAQGLLSNVQNIVLGRKYRVVILKPYYLPRQSYVTFQRGVNVVSFKRMIPSDFDLNGRLDFGDIGAFFIHPMQWRLILP